MDIDVLIYVAILKWLEKYNVVQILLDTLHLYNRDDIL